MHPTQGVLSDLGEDLDLGVRIYGGIDGLLLGGQVIGHHPDIRIEDGRVHFDGDDVLGDYKIPHVVFGARIKCRYRTLGE